VVAFSAVFLYPSLLETNMEDPAKRPAEDSKGASPDGPRQEADYLRIVDSVPGCILVADAEGQIVYANTVAVATLGRQLEDLLGNGWLMSLDPRFWTVFRL
jgi:PAS domain-containing protein